jgi:hypothetical protein
MKTISKYITKIDIYGHPINLTYRGSSTYKTLLGGLFTMLVRFLVLAFFLYEMMGVIYNTPSIIVTTQHIDLTNDGTIYSFNSS